MKLVGWGKEIDVIKEWVKNQVNSPVDFSIRFPNSHPSYISTLVWKSSNEAVLSSDGEVHKSDEKDEKVILTCEITYNGEKAVVEMEVLVPKKTDAEKNFEVRAWLDEKFANIEKVDSDLITVIEGSYSCHPKLREFYKLCIFMDISKELQIQRLKVRNPMKLDDFKNIWIPREESYFDICKIRENCDLTLSDE